MRRVIEADGGDVEVITCPATPDVEAGTQTTCHGHVDGGDETVVVSFQDGEGHFTLTED